MPPFWTVCNGVGHLVPIVGVTIQHNYYTRNDISYSHCEMEIREGRFLGIEDWYSFCSLFEGGLPVRSFMDRSRGLLTVMVFVPFRLFESVLLGFLCTDNLSYAKGPTLESSFSSGIAFYFL